MTLPILPPRLESVAAFLKPGDELVHRATGQRHKVERAHGVRVELRDGWLGQGSPHTEMRVRTGTGWAVFIDGRCYHDAAGRRGPSLRALWEDYVPPVIPSLLAKGPTVDHSIGLMEMQNEADFCFYPRQFDVLCALARTRGALLAAETGAGKTLMGMALARLARGARTLFLVPQAVMPQWLEQFARFWPAANVQRLTPGAIVGGTVAPGLWLTYHHEFLLNDGGLAPRLAATAFDTVIVDEAHLIQNPDTLMGAALWMLRPSYRYALTATPVPNRLREIYPLCRWLRPDVEYHYNTQSEYIKYADGRHEEVDPIIPVSPALFAAELSPVVAAVRKVDLRPDLPPCHLELVWHEMDDEQQSAYRAYQDLWTLPRGDAGTIARVRLTYLRTVCALGTGPKNMAVAARTVSLLSRDQRVVIACARTEQADLLQGLIEDLWRPGITARIDSTVPAGSHASAASAFKAGAKLVMLIGAKCAYGHSFTGVDWLLIASPEWGLGTIVQTLGRVWRLDSPRPVHCEIHVCKDTVEEEVVQTAALKESAATSVLYGSDCPLLLPSTHYAVDKAGVI